MGRGGNSVRIAYLDGIRALAIIAVLGVHWAYPYTGIGRGGYVGVDVFFVLSGFIITKILWSGRDTRTYREFMSGRFRRLYPALIALVVIVVPLSALVGSVSMNQASLGALFALFQVNTFVRGLGVASADPFAVTWSLSAEWIFYLIWPAVVLRAVHFSRRRLALLVALLAIALYAVALTSTAEWFYYGPVSRGAQLLAGAAVALAIHGWSHEQRAWKLIAHLGAPLALVAILAWTLAGPPEYSDAYRFVGFPLATAAAITLVLSGETSSRAISVRLLSARPAALLGRSSYSLYLWHLIPLVLLDKDVIPLPPLVLGAIAIASAFVMTWLSYTFLEKPFMRSRARDIAEQAVPSGP